MDTKTQAVMNALAEQRNQAQNQVATMAGELADLQEKLVAANQENVALKAAVEKLAPSQETVDHQPV